jgi:hypothetical protein
MGMVRGRTGYWVVDHGLATAGFVLLVAGLTVAPRALTGAWLALGLSLCRWLAEADGVAWPLRLGRRAIETVGCWEAPLAFTIRHRGETLLFARAEDPVSGGWSDAYTVYAGAATGGALPVSASAWTRRGVAPVASLAFERHERVCYVHCRSLERAVAPARG